MLLHRVFHRNRRAVSPVIASILMIALAIAAGAVITAVLINIEDRPPISESGDTDLGTTSSEEINPTVSISKLTRDPFLYSEGISDYVSINIQVTYNGQNPAIYVMDIDILLFGQKLDEISQWSIESASGALLTTYNGEFGGYRQLSGSTANYVVSLENINETEARIPDNTNFVYEVKVGSQPGIVTNTIRKQKISEIIFNPVFYKVAIFHYGSAFLPDDSARQFESTLESVNGSQKLYYLYNRDIDAYDYQNNLASINATSIAETYNLVFVDVWAVPTMISSQLMEIHQSGTNLIFYGSVNDLGPYDLATIQSNINSTATELISGIIPASYDPNVYPESGGGTPSTDNGYQFFSGSTSALTGISGQGFDEYEWPNKGDAYGYDAADLSPTYQNNVTVYGNASYSFFKGNSAPYWEHLGPLYLFKPDVTNETGRVFTFIWKHNEDLEATSTATITNTNHLNQIRRNMVTTIFTETDRIALVDSELSIQDLYVYDITSNGNKRNEQFVTEFIASVDEGIIKEQTLVFTLDMPDELQFGTQTGNPMIYVDINNDGNPEITDIDVIIDTGNVITVDVGSNYDQPIPVGNIIKVTIPGAGKQLQLDTANTNTLTWNLEAAWGVIGKDEVNFDISIDANVDSEPPTKITGLVANAISSSQIDLSWDASPEADLDYYVIYRNGTQIATSSTNSFSDTGLNSNTLYGYQVSAVDTSGNEGLKSDEATATTLNALLQITNYKDSAISNTRERI